jgi:hypothetical protein
VRAVLRAPSTLSRGLDEGHSSVAWCGGMEFMIQNRVVKPMYGLVY